MGQDVTVRPYADTGLNHVTIHGLTGRELQLNYNDKTHGNGGIFYGN